MAASLSGLTFQGHLQPPEGQPYSLTYAFGASLGPTLPPEARKERAQLGWPVVGITVLSAQCSIPSLGLKDEEVLVTLDPTAADGSRRLLLQSTQRPELGLTVLRLSQKGDTLLGGDETWSQGDPPIIQAWQGGQAPSKNAEVTVTRPVVMETSGYPPKPAESLPELRARLPVAPGTAARARTPSPGSPIACGEGGGVLPVGDLAPSAQPADAVRFKAVEGGVGRSAGGTSTTKHRVAPTRRQERPDLAVAEGGAVADPAELDRQILKSEQDGCERLVAAASHGDLPELRQLIARYGPTRRAPAGAGPNGRHEGWTPLAAAADRGRTDAIAVLLEKRSDPDSKDDEGWTPLMRAVDNERLDVVEQLLNARASAQTEAGKDGITPLMLAAAGAHPSSCSSLLKAGALKEASDSEGRRAVHYAARGGRGGALVALLEAKAKLDIRDKEGSTPLILAATAGRTSTVRILLAQRADASAQDPDGRTAKDLALINGQERTVEVLRAGGG
mmetsp:Transcript_48075/g.107939  ORF Transcript_48075/g.107939 Transcript_48075/m.107939 type:complete len:504 (-) Transcript_48075:64-1575(-)